MNNLKNIVVLGGGTAGWLTALFARKFFPQSSVTVVESEEIGILGAGEGTTPYFVNFLKTLDIVDLEVIANTKGSIKVGISFENWNGDGGKYFHGFGENYHQINQFTVKNYFGDSSFNYYCDYLLANNLEFRTNRASPIMAYQNKVPFYYENGNIFSNGLAHAIHFDARSLAQYLRGIAERRNIARIEGKMQSVESDSEGNITALQLEGGKRVPLDFIFDCSGFARLIIGKHFQTPWVNYQKHLPVNAAIPFFPKQDEDKVVPYTKAIAMKYGWMWQIPLQHRYGAGYVFDSNMISPDQAKQELDEFMGYEVESPRTFKFNAGRYEKVWVKNAMSVGLASGFTEPIEATSLWLSSMQLTQSIGHMPAYLYRDQPAIDKFNDIVANTNDHIMSFLYLHYVTQRDDTDFWRHFTDNNVVPDNLKELLGVLENQHFSFKDVNKEKFAFCGFEFDSYMQVCEGQQLINRGEASKVAMAYDLKNNLSPSREQYLTMSNQFIAAQSMDHKAFLNSLNQLFKIKMAA